MLWIVSLTGWLLAVVAFMTARQLSRRLADLTEQYWALKYAQGELKSRVDALDPAVDHTPAAAGAPPAQAFIPLGSVKR